jgi:hypothetical protein
MAAETFGLIFGLTFGLMAAETFGLTAGFMEGRTVGADVATMALVAALWVKSDFF